MAVVFAVLVLAGLVGGLSAAAAWHDWRSDGWHPRAGRTHRVLITSPGNTQVPPESTTPRGLAQQALSGGSALETASSVVVKTLAVRLADGREPRPIRVLFVDDAWPEVFSFGVSENDLRAMERAGAYRLTRVAAASLGLASARQAEIEGGPRPLLPPVPDPPANSHLRFDAIAPVSLLPKAVNLRRGDIIVANDNDAVTYVVVRGEAVERATAQVEAARLDLTGATNKGVRLQPLRQIRLRPAPPGDAAADQFVTGRGQDFYAAIALAAIAFLGASTCAALLVRAMIEREAPVIGVLKAVGGTPASLGLRLALELGAVAATALLLATVLSIVLGPALFGALGRPLGLEAVLGPALAVNVAATALVILISLAAAAPLLARPTPALLANSASVAASVWSPGFIAVGFQAALCVSVVFMALFVRDQLTRAVETSGGFAEVWRIELQETDRPEAVKAALETSPGVRQVVLASWAPYSPNEYTSPVRLSEQSVMQSVHTTLLWADEDVSGVLGQDLIAGEPPDSRDAASCRAVVNRELVSRLGLAGPQAAIGRTLNSVTGAGHFACVVVGVTEDVRFQNARLPISPAMHLVSRPDGAAFAANYAFVRADRSMTAGRLHAVMSRSGEVGLPQRMSQLEQRAYQSDLRLIATLSLAAAVLIIIISATLASAVALLIEERAVEIGVRRSLGSAWPTIAGVLVRPLGVVAVLGALSGAPVAVWIGLRWSQGLQQPVSLSGVSLLAAAAVLLIPLGTALAFNWARLMSVSPAQVLRS